MNGYDYEDEFEDDGDMLDMPPRRVSVDEQRAAGMAHSNFVAPAPLARRESGPPVTLRDMRDMTTIEASRVYEPVASVREVGKPQDRAVATVIRAAPLVGLLFPATIALVWLLDVSAWWLFPLWALMGIAGYLAIVLMDLQHNSPASTERHRINKGHDLDRLRVRLDHELKRDILDAWLRHLDKDGE